MIITLSNSFNGICVSVYGIVQGGDVSVCDSSNYSPLVWACAHGCLDTSRQLLKLTSRDLPSSDTPDDCVTETGLCLRIACGVGSVDVCQLLIRTSSSVRPGLSCENYMTVT